MEITSAHPEENCESIPRIEAEDRIHISGRDGGMWVPQNEETCGFVPIKLVLIYSPKLS